MKALQHMGAMNNITLLSAGTDGIDGNSYAAGAIADSIARDRAHKAGLDINRYLADNNGTVFFEKIHSLVVTESTGTNVMDFMALMVTAR